MGVKKLGLSCKMQSGFRPIGFAPAFGVTVTISITYGSLPNMLWTVGLVSGYTLGGVIHLLLVIALIVVAIQFIQGRRRV
jgi:hypothetical protein